MAGERESVRVLVVCDRDPRMPDERIPVSARRKAREWSAAGSEVWILAAAPQPPGSLVAGALEIEESWVDGIPLYQVRFAPPGRLRTCRGHGSEPLLRLALERVVHEFQPGMLCLVLGPFFGAIPLRKAVEYGIPVDIVDSEHILDEERGAGPQGRLHRRISRAVALLGRRSESVPTRSATQSADRRSVRRALRSAARR